MIEDWFRGILTDGILSNLSGLFDSVNTEVGEIATQVGTTPAGWNAGIFNMIRSLSENVIVPIAGVIITFVMCYELIQLVIEKNNLHDLDTWIFFKWIVKIPLFHWGEGHRKIKSAKIELQKAEVMRDEMIEKMQLEVTRNYNILNEAELEVELTENAFSYAEENLQESSKSFETGMETLANFLEAQASWQKAYFEVISAKINYRIAKSKYLNSIGGL